MKRSVNTLVLMLTLSTALMAQKKEYKGFEVTKEITIHVSAETLWNMVGPGFENVYKWASTVDHSAGTGTAEFDGASCSTRSCDLNAKGFSKIEEQLTKYDQNQMNLAYEVLSGMPGFITKASNDWTVVPIDENHSKLVMVGEFRVKGLMGSLMKGVMEKKMSKLLQVVLNDAKVYAETGNPSQIKKERMEKLLAKS